MATRFWPRRLALVLVLGLSAALLGAAQTPPLVQVASHPSLGAILTGPDGMTLYTFAKDEPGTLGCTGGCAVNWPPLLVQDELVVPEGLPGQLGTITREPDEESETQVQVEQLTYNGQPLYYWSRDEAPGDATGHGIGDLWFVARP